MFDVGAAEGEGMTGNNSVKGEGVTKETTLPRLLSPLEISRLTGIPRPTVYDLIARGEFPVVQIGRSVRVTESDLARWIESKTEVRK